MKELKHYDKAASQFYEKRLFFALPLTSWDLFAEQFSTTEKSLSDIQLFKKLAIENRWATPVLFKDAILNNKHVVVVTDVSLNIIQTSQNIFKMNGYTANELVGKKPKIFQGKDTCKNTARKIGKAVKDCTPFEATILNYRKDGSPYHCWIMGLPIKNASGKVVNFIAFEKEVA